MTTPPGPGSRAGTSPQQTPRQVLTLAALFGTGAVLLILLAVYAAEVSEWLEARFPTGANPIPAIFFALSGVTLALITWSNLREAARARTWPVARGRIVRSEVEHEWISGGARRVARIRGYRPLVEYEYAVEGREYRSRRVRLGAVVTSGDEAAAQAEIGRYAAGSDVEVRYDPAEPQTALLEIDVALKWRTIAIAVVFLALAVYFGGWLRR